jgi:hypothetical protein
VEKAQEELVQEVDRGYDAVGTEERDQAQIQKRGGEETTTTTQENLDQEVYHGNDGAEEEEDHGYDYVGTEERELTQIQKWGGEETTTQDNLDQEVYHGNDVRGEEERPYAPTMAPIDPKTASGTINGVYISSPIQHNNILRSHHLFSQLQMMSVFATMMRILPNMIMTSTACMKP